MGHRTTKTNHKVKVHKTVSCRVDFFYYAFRNVLLVSIPLLVVCAPVLGLSVSRSSARVSSSDNLSISVPSSCTLSSSVDEAHSASIINGTYRSDIGTTTLSTFCNDKNGYSVYTIGDSLNSEGNNTLVGSNGSNISSGTATSGDTSNWAMKLSLKAGDTSPTPPTIISPFDNYATVPITWTKVATIPSGTTDMEKGSSFTTTYATYISPTQAAGTYLGQVKYLLTHPSAATPTSAYIMQEVAEWEDDLSSPGDSVQAIDIRDGKQYWVTRLADGHIWMTQNLDLEGGTSITSELSDVPEGYTLPIANGFGVNNTLPASSTSTFSNNTLAYVYNSGNNTNNCSKPGCYSYYSWVAATAGSGINMSENNSNAPYSICPKGWKLPTSGTRTPYTDYSDFYNLAIAYGMAPGSTSDSSSATGGNFYVQAGPGSIPNFVLNGSYFNTLYNGNSLGEYWSATLINGQSSYRFSFSSSNVYTAYNQYGDHKYGNSIRCIAK